MAIKNSVSSDFSLSMFVDSINIFVFRAQMSMKFILLINVQMPTLLAF